MKVKLKSQTGQSEPKEINWNQIPVKKPIPQAGVLSRMIAIVVDDICVTLNINRKAREDKMKYDAFMEMFK